jgi:hypothetical protein
MIATATVPASPFRGPRLALAVLAIVALACLAPLVRGSPPTVYVQPQYVAPQYAPAYGVQYPDPAALAASIDRLTDRLGRIEELLAGRAGEPVPLKAPLPKEVGLLRANCAGCHSGTAAKGAGHVFDFDALPPATLKMFAKEVLEGRMPKGKTLDEKARTALVLACFDPKK